MTLKSVIDENVNPFEILVKWFQRKYSVLILISDRNESENHTTVFNIMEAFEISRRNAYKILGDLQNDKSVERGDKIKQYHSYILTEGAKKELKIISKILNRNMDPKFQ